ncbi:hypothetical protein D3C83_177390 [compost metagenome]
MVSRSIRYSLAAKKKPTSTRHIDEPNGSSMIPDSPFSRNFAGMPSTVSEPNHVANTVAMTT